MKGKLICGLVSLVDRLSGVPLAGRVRVLYGQLGVVEESEGPCGAPPPEAITGRGPLDAVLQASPHVRFERLAEVHTCHGRSAKQEHCPTPENDQTEAKVEELDCSKRNLLPEASDPRRLGPRSLGRDL
jgi:hypothetical protein